MVAVVLGKNPLDPSEESDPNVLDTFFSITESVELLSVDPNLKPVLVDGCPAEKAASAESLVVEIELSVDF